MAILPRCADGSFATTRGIKLARSIVSRRQRRYCCRIVSTPGRQSGYSRLTAGVGAGAQSLSVVQPSLSGAILRHMKVEEIAEAVAKLPPDQLARFRRWFTAFEAGRTNHAEELDSAATKLGRLAGRAFGELKRRAKEP